MAQKGAPPNTHPAQHRNNPVLSNSEWNRKEKKSKGKSPKQVYSSFNKFYLEYLIVGSSWLSPKGQKLLPLCPVDKVEEKRLESCLCSEKESVWTVRAVPQKCPGQGLRTRGSEGQEDNLGSGGLEAASLLGAAFKPWDQGHRVP